MINVRNTYIKGVGWCSGMKVGLHVSGRGIDSHKESRERRVCYKSKTRDRQMGQERDRERWDKKRIERVGTRKG